MSSYLFEASHRDASNKNNEIMPMSIMFIPTMRLGRM